MVSADRDALRSLQQAITRAVIPEGAPSTLLQRSSEQFTASRLYTMAWVGRVDEQSDAVVPIAAAGVPLTDLDSVPLAERRAGDRDERPAPVARAVDEEAICTDGTLPGVPTAVDDRPTDGWRSRARELGCRSVAAVPLRANGRLHGVLHLATDRRYAFDAEELAVLTSVGETLALAVSECQTATSGGTQTLVSGENGGEPTPAGTQALAREHQTLTRIVETIGDGIYALDEASRFTRVNDAFCELTGYDRDELLGEPAAMIHSEGTDAWLTSAMDAARTEPGDPDPVELPLTTADGDVVTAEAKITPFEFDDGSKGRVGVVRDLTARKRRERTLQSYRAIAEAASDAIVTIDEDSVVRSANPAVADVFGYEPEELVGESLATLMTGDQSRAHEAGIERYLETGERALDWSRVELDGQHRDGHTVPLSISFSEYEYDGERYFTGIIRDVTERKQYERALTELHAATRDLIQAETAVEVAERTLDTATNVLDLDGVGVYLFDDVDNELQPVAVTEYVEELFGEVPAFGPGDTSITWETFLTGETVGYGDVLETDDVYTTETPLRSGIWIPLGEHGVLAIVSEAVDGIDDRVQQLSDHLAATAEVALDRVAREETLRDHEQELAEQNRRLQALDRMNAVIREIDQRLVAATTKADVEQSVCELLTRSERFAFAWIGGVEGGTVVPRASAGDDRGYLDEVALAIGDGGGTVASSATDVDASESSDDSAEAGGEDAGSSDPTASLADPAVATAASDGVTVVDNVASELGSAPWRKAALSRDLQSAIAVPIRYGETRYGVLAVYAAEPDAFDDLTQSVLAELGGTIGNAMHAVETERALLTDSVVELELAIQEGDDPLVGIAEETGCTIVFEGTVPQSAGSARVFFTARGASTDALVDVAERSSHIESLTHLDTEGDEHHFEVTVDGPTIPSTLVECGAAVESVRITPEQTRAVVELPHSIDVRTFVDRLETTFPGAELVARRDKERDDPTGGGFESDVETELTDRQLEVLQTAFLSGYFEWPRERTGEEVAATLDITQSTFNGHLRTAERKLCALLFERVQGTN